jgi:hypothetical protein
MTCNGETTCLYITHRRLVMRKYARPQAQISIDSRLSLPSCSLTCCYTQSLLHIQRTGITLTQSPASLETYPTPSNTQKSTTMRFLTSFACTTPLITLTTARITGFSAPSTVASGAPIEIQLQGRGYIQSVQNVAVAFGIAPLDSYYPGTLGKLIGEQFLGPGKVSHQHISFDLYESIGWMANV